MRNICRVLASVVLLGFALESKAEGSAAQPNIILIMADDLGAECLSSYGSASYKTPRLDQMAAEGMRFTNSHSMPLCTPSRVAIMTGKYNSRNYISFGALDPGESTFGNVLKEAGYATGITGKWQLDGGKDEVAGSHPEGAGFDEYLLWHYTKRGERYANPELKLAGEDVTRHAGKYGPDLMNEFALSFIERHKGAPFFLYYPMCLVHDPFQPTPDSDEWQEGNRMKRSLKNFPAMVAYMDKMVGNVLDKVDALGLSEHTLVIFTGDNGTDRDVTSRMTDGREIEGGKGLTLDTGTHVPMIARWKGTIEGGALNENLTSFEDFLPTLAEAGGVKLAEDRVVDGKSFLAQLKGEAATSREWIYVPYNPLHNIQRELVRYARDTRWKLYGDGRLFDVIKDAREKSALDAGAEPEVRARLQAVLDTQP